MDITVLHEQYPIPFIILQLDGSLDGTSYQMLIDEAQKQYDAGARNLVLDLSRVTFLSSAGLSALHTVALIYRGQKPIERQGGWASFHAMGNDRANGPQDHVKLLGPTGEVQKVIDLVGFNAFFNTYPDVTQAVASFQ